jgi:hypothetical protein
MADNIELGTPTSTKRLEVADLIATQILNLNATSYRTSALASLATKMGKNVSSLTKQECEEVALAYAELVQKISYKMRGG